MENAVEIMKKETQSTEMMRTNETPRVLVAGCACVITSLLTSEQLERFKRFQPEAMILYDENDGHEIYRMDIGEGPGKLLEDHAEYSRVSSRDGKATVTIILDPEIENKRQAIEEIVCPSLMHLDRLERQLLSKLSTLDQEHDRTINMVRFL